MTNDNKPDESTEGIRKGILVLHRSGREVSSAANGVMILFSGYPDTTVTFSDFAKCFEDEFHVVRIAYPDLDQQELRRYWGYSMDEIVDALAVVVREYTDSIQGKAYDDSQTPPPIYMVGHDWGSVIVQKYISKYPKGVRKAVLEDVGVVYPNPKDTPLTTLLGIMSYHTYLTFLFILSRIVGNDSWTTWFHFLFALYPWWLIGPLKTNGNTVQALNRINPVLAHQCYPYFRNMIAFVEGKAMPRFVSTVPQLYLYGANKRFMFHSGRYLKKLEATEGCAYKEYTDGGHWLHESHCDEMAQDVLSFLES